ncbi:hypothetical protein NADE_009118 [Nannochloris sp. 'desiccata']|nr:hypothetical protein KSW81_006113 [Chlorella desiccata (nom. nud.)]KAH7621060.1 hypothetical protein NADE_009118 [Chlorella desiccata (nom. nud.)]
MSWPLDANDAGLELNKLELNTLSGFPQESGVGWTSELYFADEVADDASPLTTVFAAELNKKKIKVLVDCGSSLNIVSESFVNANALKTAAAYPVGVKLADGRRHTGNRVLRHTRLKLNRLNDVLNLRVFPVQQYDVILGLPWLKAGKVQVDWDTGNIAV